MIASFGDYHHIPDGTFDGAALELLGDLPDAGRRLHQSRVRELAPIGNLLEDSVEIDDSFEALMKETGRADWKAGAGRR